MKKLGLILLPFSLLSFCLCGCEPIEKDSNSDYWDTTQESMRKGTKTFDFYNINDFHGTIEASSSEPGIAKISTYIKNKYKENENTIFTSSGDMWQGSAASNITRGEMVIDWMNYLDCKAQALGNHEFDWTIDTIKSNEKKMNFPMLACNIINTSTNEPVDWVEPYTKITKNGLRIGIIGAIGEGITSSIFADNVKDLKFADPTSYIIKHSKTLKEEGADIIILLLHHSASTINHEINSYVDMTFCGHTHSSECELIGNMPAIQGWCNGKSLSHVKLTYNFNSKSKNIADYGYIDSNDLLSMSDDSKTIELYNSYSSQIDPAMNQVAKYDTDTIEYEDVPFLYDYCAVQYFNNEIKDNYPIIGCVHNNARAAIYPNEEGNITYKGIYKALPFDNYLTVVKIKGAAINQNLASYSAAAMYLTNGSFARGHGIRSIMNSVTDFSTSSFYYFLMIDYMSVGTSYLTIEKQYQVEDSLPREIVFNYLNECLDSFYLTYRGY